MPKPYKFIKFLQKKHRKNNESVRKYVADKQKKFQEAKEMRENLNWAVLGTGVIANEMAQALQKMGKSLYAVGNRTI